ncbi:MAG: helix-turn-helix transcriptional regulator [Planctomycetota bacterium]|nr:helix-turn-helix transcriptional regulator [Planctomycetota bacterium]
MSKQTPNTISDQLRKIIKTCGHSRYAISHATGVDQGALSRFMVGESKLSLENIDRMAAFLGLRLTQDKRRRKKGG